MASKVTTAMLEITGQCSRGCPSCLPPRLRTNRNLEMSEVVLLASQFRDAGLSEVTLCGYGNPAEHPDLKTIVWLLGCRLKMKVNIVCRPDQIDKAWIADSIFVSIDCLEDVNTLKRQNPSFVPGFFPFVMLSDRSAPDLEAIIKGLMPSALVPQVSFSHPMVLCDDAAHRAQITAMNANLPANEDKFSAVVEALPATWRPKIKYFGVSKFREVCRFHGSPRPMIYIGADLKVRQCCHKPVSEPLGDLRRERLADVLAGPVAKFHETWQDNPDCQLCPDDGLATL